MFLKGLHSLNLPIAFYFHSQGFLLDTNFPLVCLIILCSEWVPSEPRVQIADKHITVIHT